MKCPICDVELQMTERQQIEIDYCPKCRGVWLDRGELDKIIERSTQGTFDKEKDYEDRQSGLYKYDDDHDYDGHHRDHDDHHHNEYYGKKKHKSFLENIFDIG